MVEKKAITLYKKGAEKDGELKVLDKD